MLGLWLLVTAAANLQCWRGQETRGVVLVAWDMDETLTLQTNTPPAPPMPRRTSRTIREEALEAVTHGRTGFQLTRLPENWQEQMPAMLNQANFGTPRQQDDYDRLTELQEMLGSLQAQGVELMVLTFNQAGPMAVLNVLRVAGLDRYFAAIYGLPTRDHLGRDRPAGMVRVDHEDGTFGWISSELTFVDGRTDTLVVFRDEDHDDLDKMIAERFDQPEFLTPLADNRRGAKAAAMARVLANPSAYLPPRTAARVAQAGGSLSGAVLMDDKQENRVVDEDGERSLLPNFCQVLATGYGSRRSGGIAARTYDDFVTLQRSFPWGPATEAGAKIRRLIAEFAPWGFDSELLASPVPDEDEE